MTTRVLAKLQDEGLVLSPGPYAAQMFYDSPTQTNPDNLWHYVGSEAPASPPKRAKEPQCWTNPHISSSIVQVSRLGPRPTPRQTSRPACPSTLTDRPNAAR